MASNLNTRLKQALCSLPANFQNRYETKARKALLDILFRCLTNDRSDYYSELFPDGVPESGSLKDAQTALEEPEYTEAARGQPCGHILKPNEATYSCSTCTDDPTCVLCSRCWTASDHEGHSFDISISSGNAGCCDCGDDEAWKRPVICGIHTSRRDHTEPTPARHELPEDLAYAVHATIGTVLDYVCDVISCSPESLRAQKTQETVEQDEKKSRLKTEVYGTEDQVVERPEYSLVIWNDEKHTMDEVREQVKKACRQTRKFGEDKANEANDIGRSIVRHSSNLQELLHQAKIIEQIKVTTTIRSARDTFREQMCGTILDWLNDIAGCVFHGHATYLRQAICEETFQLWHLGSEACNAKVGRDNLDDHAHEEEEDFRDVVRRAPDTIQIAIDRNQQLDSDDDDDDGDDDDLVGQIEMESDVPEEDHGDGADSEFEQVDSQMVDSMHDQDMRQTEPASDLDEMDTDGDNDFLDAAEQMEADEPAIAPMQQITQPRNNEPAIALDNDELSRQPSMTLSSDDNPNFGNIPRTPSVPVNSDRHAMRQESAHWRTSANVKGKEPDETLPVWENLRKNIRLDAMILFDLRLWKSMREQLRELLISTLVKSPQSKRILGLRFAGLYTSLAQLYLIADREPDHSIIHLSVQILTTPSIAEESVRTANFLSNLFAIVYTFLTTRQVGFPDQVDLDATLGFEAGSVANRRLYHIFHDLEMFLRAAGIQEKVRNEQQYLMQFLDLAKLSQGICPNTRAVGEHVEYEADTWISASLLTREINKLCRHITKAFTGCGNSFGIDENLTVAIRQSTVAAMLVCSGLDEQRRDQSEVKEWVSFHEIGPFPGTDKKFKTVNFIVEKGTLSFHHPLHYTISWLLEHGKESYQAIEVLQHTAKDLVDRFIASKQQHHRLKLHNLYTTGEDALLAIFDYPLRVCAWLAQIRANMWVRNGISLRHQMGQYKGTTHRDLGYQRDLMLLQTAFVACDPERFLGSMIDRFGLINWVSGKFASGSDADFIQLVDIAEEFVYLLINVLSDRDSLSTSLEHPETQVAVIRKELAHILCFKPLSYTEMTNRLTERSQDHERLQEVIDSMTTFKAPEALNDTGLFELKPEFLKELDPYNSHFSKNQRDEAENIYKAWMAKHTNKQADDIVLEPKLSEIRSEAYANLCVVVHTPLFTSVVYSMLSHVAANYGTGSVVTASRAESFLQVVLQLILIATMEDRSVEDDARTQSLFIRNALTLQIGSQGQTVVKALHKIWLTEDFNSCKSKARHILKLFSRQWPRLFAEQELEFPAARLDAPSPASFDLDVEAKKKQAMERKARIMAQMQQQQQSFMTNQGMTEWDDDDMSDSESVSPVSSEERHWKLPSGVCIQCREETNDNRFYGTFAMVVDAHLLRQTPKDDPDFIQEVLLCPDNLDESIESMRPFGVAGANVQNIKRYASDGSDAMVERTVLSKGWPKDATKKEAIASSCGHIMHYTCFENYYESIKRRHNHQIQRRQPERLELNEFVCPLCKALANVFLPIAYKSTTQSYPGRLKSESSYEMFTDEILPALRTTCTALEQEGQSVKHWQDLEKKIHLDTLVNFTTTGMGTLSKAIAEHGQSANALFETPAFPNLVRLNSIYARLTSTLQIVNGKAGSIPDLVDWYMQLVANSVVAVEIGMRGRPSVGPTLVDGIPSQTLSHLQVLASALSGYAACLNTVAVSGVGKEYTPYQYILEVIVDNIFPGSERRGHQLAMDGFSTFVEMTFIFTTMHDLPIVHLLRLCLTQEMIRVAIWWLKVKTTAQASDTMPRGTKMHMSKEEYMSMGRFLFWFTSSLPATASSPMPNVEEVPSLYKALRVYALAFLRKSVLFLHVAHGIDFPAPTHTAHLSELDRLLELCTLPALHVILGDFSETTESMPLPKLVRSWIRALPLQHHTANPIIKLMHPAPFELIGLPKYHDTLLEECQKRRCPTTGKSLTDPALCLFCGDIFCTQAWCCMPDGQRGGCNHHIEKCSAPIGAYLFIRKCNIMLLDVPKQGGTFPLTLPAAGRNSPTEMAHGSFFQAPYLTKHGETDQGLRTKRQLILNQKRYDKLVRDVWLLVNGSIWSAIARKLESEFNAGGWETL